MKVVDANVLLYAVDTDARHHQAAKEWLDDALSQPEPVGFTWIVIMAFLRISTNSRIYANPLSPDQSLDVVDSWLSQPSAVIVDPGVGHLATLRTLLSHTGAGGNLINDAHIAALAVDNRANVVSFDNDFGRFPSVRWETPKD